VRLKSAFAVLLISVAASSSTLTGQEDAALPPVTPKVVLEATPDVVLAVEPLRATHQPTLVEAVRFNDFVTFDALYREAKARGESLGAFTTLHELWSWSMNDPLGAFYGRDLYERLSAAFPGYANYIDDYRIVDSHGNVFWPTSETRAFLLRQALEGAAPRTLIAGTPASTASPAATGAPASPPADAAASRRRASRRAPVEIAVLPAPIPAPAPAQVAARDAATSAGEDASAPQTEVAATVADAAPVVTETLADIAPVAVAQAQQDLGSRGILLLIIGLIGVGLLAIMLRTPDEPEAATESVATVEPITMKQMPEASTSETPRATGSHG
jgi:hypothetical protein